MLPDARAHEHSSGDIKSQAPTLTAGTNGHKNVGRPDMQSMITGSAQGGKGGTRIAEHRI